MAQLKDSPQVIARGRAEYGRKLAATAEPKATPRVRRRGSGWGGGDGGPSGGAFPVPKATFGLWVFLGVVTVLFAIIVTLYLARMKFWDWHPLPEPGILWFNTGVLILSSLAMQMARRAASRGRIDSVRNGLVIGGLCAWTFLAGQLWAWRELSGAGYFVAANPANSFFYMITALHGLHLLGGLIAGGVTIVRLWDNRDIARVRLSIDLCAVYWHFLLAVWVVLFGLMLLT